MQIGKVAVERKLITIAQLKACLDEQQRLSQQGTSVSLDNLLIRKSLLTTDEIESLRHEQKTMSMKQQQRFPELGGEEVLLGKYKVLEKLGAGGMGAVYKVEHILLQHNRFFALKIMHACFANNETNYKRFVREVEVAMGLVHRNIVAIREFGLLSNQSPYLIMDFSPGKTLEWILQNQWQCDLVRSIEIISQILEGVGEAHKCNVIHRDLKPANILIETSEQGKEVIKIVDFGLAKLAEESEHLESLTQGILGTPLYMSPEQASGEKVDRRTDIYSIGMILYEMVTGRLPFKTKSLREMLVKQMFEKPANPRQVNDKIPIDLENIILKAIEKNVDERFASVQEFQSAILQCSVVQKDKPIELVTASKVIAPTSAMSQSPQGVAGVIFEQPKTQPTPLPKESGGKRAALVFLFVGMALLLAYFAVPGVHEKVQQILGQASQGIDKPTEPVAGNKKLRSLLERVKALDQERLWKDAYTSLLEAKDLARDTNEQQEVQAWEELLKNRMQEEREYQKVKEDATLAYDRKQYAEAIRYLKLYIANFPNSIYKPEIQKRIEDLSQAQEALARAEQQQIEAQYNKRRAAVLTFIDQKFWNDASQALIELKKIQAPNSQELAQLKEWEALIQQKLDEEKEYQKVKEQAGRDRERSSYATAIQQWESFLSQYPSSDRRKDIMAEIEFLKGLQETRSKERYRQIVAEAKIHISNKEYTKAIELLLEAKKYSTQDTEAMALLGSAYYYKRDWKNAQIYLAMAEKDLSSDMLQMLSDVHAKQGAIAQAIAIGIRAIAKYQDDKDPGAKLGPAYVHLAKLYEKAKDSSKALASYQKAAEYIEKGGGPNSTHRDIYQNLILLMKSHGDSKEILRYIKTYQSIGGTDQQILNLVIELADYTPMSVGKKWNYVKRIGSQKLYGNFEIVDVNQGKFLVKVDQEVSAEWYREGEYAIQYSRKTGNSEKILKYPIRLNSTWTNEMQGTISQYKIVELQQTVATSANVFRDCIKVLVQDSPTTWSYVYYAPEIGKVKQERVRQKSPTQTQIVFEEELVSY